MISCVRPCRRVPGLLFAAMLVAGCGGDLNPADRPISDTTAAAVDEAVRRADSLSRSLPAMLPSGSAAIGSADTLDAAAVDRLSAAISELAGSISAYVASQPEGRQMRDVTLGEAGEAAQDYGMRIFLTILLLFVTYFFVKGLTFVLDKISEVSAERRLFYKRLVPISRVLFWSISLYFIVRVVFEVNTQSLLAAAAAIGVAVGFAAQDIVKNIFGGFIIISDRPFQVGDKILIDGTYGEVTAIGLRSTRIVTPDDSVVSVPNAQVVNSQVSNANTGALDCQVVTDLYLPGWVDETRAKRIAYEAAVTSKYVYLRKPITVLIRDEFKETFLTHIKVKAYVLDTRYEFLLMSDITEKARRAFREAGLVRDVFRTDAWIKVSGVSAAAHDMNGDETTPDESRPDTAA